MSISNSLDECDSGSIGLSLTCASSSSPRQRFVGRGFRVVVVHSRSPRVTPKARLSGLFPDMRVDRVRGHRRTSNLSRVMSASRCRMAFRVQFW